MATVYSDQKTKWDQDNPALMIKPIDMAGRVRIAYGSYTAAAEQSDIEMFNIPDGARLLSMSVVTAALGAGTTLSVGHAAYVDSNGDAVSAVVDAYKAAAASTAAGVQAALNTRVLGLNSVVDAGGDGLPVTVSIAGGNGTGLVELTCTWTLD